MAQLTHDAWFQVLLAADFPTLENCSRTCQLFRKMLNKSSGFWIQKSEKDNKKSLLPSEKWRLAAIKNNFRREATEVWHRESEVAVEKTTDFKFNLRKLVISQKGFAPFKPYKIDKNLRNHNDFKFYTFGSPVRIEPNGIGCEKDDTLEKCFAFSFRPTCVACRVDLTKLGIDDWVLDHVRPTIRIKQKVNHHHEHGSKCTVTAIVYSFPEFAIDPEVYCGFAFGEDDKSYCAMQKRWSSSENPCDWETWTLDINEYPAGMRFLQIYVNGRELNRSTSRHFFGPKVGDVEIQLILPDKPVVKTMNHPFYNEPFYYTTSDMELGEEEESDVDDIDGPVIEIEEEW